jgi:hypothetical protein
MDSFQIIGYVHELMHHQIVIYPNFIQCPSFQHVSLHPWPCSAVQVAEVTSEFTAAWLKFQTAHGNRGKLRGQGSHPLALEP